MYHGGTYGTYLEWCLTTLCSDTDIQAPFTSNGNSHAYQGHHLLNMAGWQKYLQSDKCWDVVRFHPKTLRDESLVANIESVLSIVDRAIYIYPDSDSVLLTINNFYSKIWDNWWDHQIHTEIDQGKIYDNWPVPRTVPIGQIPLWIQREFLSLYLLPAWQSQVEWDHTKAWSNSKCVVVRINDLLYNFEETVTHLGKVCQFDFKMPASELKQYHLQNLKLQQFLGQDQICQDILQTVLSDQQCEWAPLPLPSQAWVQWQLRNLGYELQCHGLDTFPTNSIQLKELLYPV